MEILLLLASIGSACGIFSAIDIFQKWRDKSTKNYLPKLPKENDENQATTILAETIDDAKLQISQRLAEMLDLINQNRISNITVSELAEFCGYETTGDLQKYFSGTEEPTKEEKEKICTCLGINPQWLKHGKGEAFRSQESYQPSAEDYLEIIKSKSPKEIIFIRSREQRGRACIVLRLNEFKYVVLPSAWNISGHVGVEGQNQICSFYKLIKTVQNHQETNYQFRDVHIFGNHVEETDFNELICGEIYPASIIKFHNDHWWDDLTDVNHAWSCAPSYKEYGKGFIEAQEIIKYNLKIE